MKKFLLFSALTAMVAMPTMAQDNLIVNGDFEENEILTWENAASDDFPSAITGWTFTGSRWNVRGLVSAYDEGTAPEGAGAQFARVERNNNGGWYTSECLKQTVELPIESHTYQLSFLMRHAVIQTRENSDVSFFIRVYTVDNPDGTLASDAQPLWEWTKDWVCGTDEAYNFTEWEEYVTPVLDTEDNEYLRVNFGLSGGGGNSGSVDNKVYMDIDNVAVVSADGSAVKEIASDATVTDVKYYGIDGVQVANPAKGQLVIVKSTLDNGAVKVSKKVVR